MCLYTASRVMEVLMPDPCLRSKSAVPHSSMAHFIQRRFYAAGLDILNLTEHEMVMGLGLSELRVRKLRKLQAATALFDSITSHRAQGSISDAKMRRFLANRGCSAFEVNKIMKLFKSLVISRASQDQVTFWDFASNYEWVLHTFKMYGLNVDVTV